MSLSHTTDPGADPAATSPLSSLHSPPTSPYFPLDNPDDGDSDEIRYDSSSTEMFEPATRRLTPQEKLERVLSTLQEVHWSFSEFLLAWVGIGDDLQEKEILIQNRQARTLAQRYRRLQRVIEKIRQCRAGAFETQPIHNTLSHELNALIRRPFFGKFDHTVHLD